MNHTLPLLSVRERLAYGAGELGPAMAGSTLVFFQLVFLTNVAGLNPGLAGSVLLIARIWDAFNDPLIGWLSDKTRSRWGRRLPWMLAGALPFALTFCLFWFGPWFLADAGQMAKFAFYSIVALFYSTATTSLALTHSALTAELSHDYDERSRLTAARMGFSLGGSVGGLVIALIVFSLLPNSTDVVRYTVFGIAVAGVGLVAVAFCLLGIWRAAKHAEHWRLAHPSVSRGAKNPGTGLRELSAVLRNRPFLIVCGIYLCSWLAMQFTAGVLPFYTTSVMGLSQTTFQSLALTVQATALLLIPVWARISILWGKKQVFFAGMAFWIAAQAGLLFLPPGNLALLYVLGFVAGFGISVCYLIPNAMLPDVIEWDEIRTGERREGIYYGFCVFLQKVALAAGTFVIGQILAVSGYVSGAEDGFQQPESALQAIRIAIGPVPAAVLFLGLCFAAIYPIHRDRHRKMVRILQKRSNRITKAEK